MQGACSAEIRVSVKVNINSDTLLWKYLSHLQECSSSMCGRRQETSGQGHLDEPKGKLWGDAPINF